MSARDEARSHETYKVHGLCVEREDDGIKFGSGVDPTADEEDFVGRRQDRYPTKKGAKMEPMF